MPICITCSTPVKHLYTTYSKADDRSLGKGVRLTQCPNCKRFADKYVEHDYVVLFIDLVLIKPQVYRHLLFNRLGTPTNVLDPSILRLGILLILFDVYITWARIERANSSPTPTTSPSSTPFRFWQSAPPSRNFASAPIITQYLFFLTLNVVATVVQHGVIRTLTKVLVNSDRSSSTTDDTGANDVGSGNGGGSPNPKIHARSGSSPSKALRGASLGTGVSTSVSTSAGLDSSASTAGHTPSGSHHHSAAQGDPIQSSYQSQLQQQVPSIDFGRGSTVSGPRLSTQTRPGAQTSPSAISTALLVSSCTKLFPILLVIWPTTTGAGAAGDAASSSTSASLESSSLAPFAYRATSYIGWVVLLNNVEALLILLNCGYVVATTLAVAGVLCRWIVEGWILSVVGLVRDAEGPVGDVVMLWNWVLGMRRG